MISWLTFLMLGLDYFFMGHVSWVTNPNLYVHWVLNIVRLQRCDMDNRSRETLLTVEQDDANLTELWIGPGHDGRFMSLMKIRQCDYVFASSCGND